MLTQCHQDIWQFYVMKMGHKIKIARTEAGFTLFRRKAPSFRAG